MADSPRCIVYGEHEEINLHAVRDCDVVRRVWQHLVPLELQPNFLGLQLREWML